MFDENIAFSYKNCCCFSVALLDQFPKSSSLKDLFMEKSVSRSLSRARLFVLAAV